MAGFNINAEAATRLMAEIQAKHTALLAEVRRDTLAAGRKMQATARQLAVSKSMPELRGSITTRTRQFANGIEVTVSPESPNRSGDEWGYIREFGAGRSGPHPFMLPALEQHVPAWEQNMADALARVL